MHVVLGNYLDTNSKDILLIKRLIDSKIIINKESSVLHQLNGSLIDDTTSLRSLIHDRDLLLLGLVSHDDRLVNWIVI